MTTFQLLSLSLVFHIIGLTMVAGVNIVGYMLQRQFWKQYAINKDQGTAVMRAASKLSPFNGIGFLLLILSGVAMMIITRGAFSQQLWFQVKLTVLAGIIINGIAFGRRNDQGLQKLLQADDNSVHVVGALLSIKNRMAIFYVTQLILFLAIVTLSVFKFN